MDYMIQKDQKSMKMKWAEILNERTANLKKELIAIRRRLHQYPGLGLEEKRTSQLICEKLKDLGITFQTGVGKTGIVGLIEGGGIGKTVGLRTDMDALPVQEETGAPYASKNSGVMHACGHDAHVACLIGAASLLVSLRDQFKGNIKLVFQPAEEIDLGAKTMILDGVLDRPRP